MADNGFPPATGDVETWRSAVLDRIRAGARFAGLYGTAVPDGCLLTVLLAAEDHVDSVQTVARPDVHGRLRYQSLTPEVPAAFWYERAAHDLSGVQPVGHPRLDPLLLPLHEGSELPIPGQGSVPQRLFPSTTAGPVDVSGHGMFTIPFGPVRSGVFESIEFLIETPGEEIPHVNIRPHYKHRGIAKRFEGLSLDDGVLVAERLEGIASVAHALAFCHAAEAIAEVPVPSRARLIRVVFAELERIANHLDVAMRLTEAAGLAVANSRFSWHKELIQRLVSKLCGSRFGRGVVIPGGVRAEPALAPRVLIEQLRTIHHRIRADATLAMQSASFLDRLRGTGPLSPQAAHQWAVLGPIGRASGIDDDSRRHRGTDAYPELGALAADVLQQDGDVLARLNVRWAEIGVSVELIAEALQRLGSEHDSALAIPVRLPDGEHLGIGWSEAPQGECLYGLTVAEHRILRCFARSASFHNLVAFHEVFRGDVLTDFAFIEASFGLSYAGVAM